jgi:hypothetical protein
VFLNEVRLKMLDIVNACFSKGISREPHQIEAVKDIDVKNLVSTAPGNYRLWAASGHKFIDPRRD